MVIAPAGKEARVFKNPGVDGERKQVLGKASTVLRVPDNTILTGKVAMDKLF